MHHAKVAEDILSTLIKTKVHDGIPTCYWSQGEQEDWLVKAFDKWVAVGRVWSAAAEQVHFLSSVINVPQCT